MDYQVLFSCLRSILSRSRFVASKEIKRILVLINPSAGGFADEAKSRSLLGLAGSQAVQEEIADTSIAIDFHVGLQAGDLQKVIQSLKDSPVRPTLLVSMGGDGTHQDILSSILLLPAEIQENLWIFRFPAGTGNDAADAWTQAQALQALSESCTTGKLGALKVSIPGRKALWSFNIASLGIDAYVVHLNNSLQKYLPGNFYRLFSDLGVLFYGLVHGYRTMKVTCTGINGQVRIEERKNAIMAMGVSGFRTYGNEKWVLPDERNFCSILKGGVIRNLQFKKKLFQAKHPDLESCNMDLVTKIQAFYPGKILMQLDGEVFPLEIKDFPLEFETVETSLNYLSAKEPATQQAVLNRVLEEKI